MRYSKVFIDTIGYELAPVVVSSDELEERLTPLYERLHIPKGQLEALTGVVERRWWEAGFLVADGAIAAAKKALAVSNVPPSAIEAVIYAGVCRENFEPATACRVASALDVNEEASVFDLSNACLGVLNGIIDIANRIELGQMRAGLVVSCESAREINNTMIARMNERGDMQAFTTGLATLTGGSGAVAVIVTDGSFGDRAALHAFHGGAVLNDPRHHHLCRWGLEVLENNAVAPFMSTDAVSVLKHGVELGKRTWRAFQRELAWAPGEVDKVICHQVGSAHQESILKTLGIAPEKDYRTFPYLGNIGTVSLPITAAIAAERDFLRRGDQVGLLGIGSGLNCMMLGVTW